MAARKGNEYWRKRSKHGRDKEHTPETLMEAACEYFRHVESTPFKVDKLFSNGTSGQVKVHKPFTQKGLCLFVNITEDTYRNYQKDKDFFEVTKEIDLIIYDNKFTGAATGLFNSNIIARDLGLTDKQETKVIAEQPLFSPLDDSK